MTEAIHESLKHMARNGALRDAAADVCMVCGGRASGTTLRGPNMAGNYTHGDDICPATAIWSRIHFESREYVRRLQENDPD